MKYALKLFVNQSGNGNGLAMQAIYAFAIKTYWISLDKSDTHVTGLPFDKPSEKENLILNFNIKQFQFLCMQIILIEMFEYFTM